MPFGFRVDHEVLEAVVKEPGPSLMHPHPPGAVDALFILVETYDETNFNHVFFSSYSYLFLCSSVSFAE